MPNLQSKLGAKMLSVTTLREKLHYDPVTGIFRWRQSPTISVPSGAVAGSLSKQGGHYVIGIGRKTYLAHRLAWLYVHGEWPNGILDHINRDRTDNRIENLRLITKAGNSINRDAPANSKTGRPGVSWSTSRSKWRAYITVNNRQKHLGHFSNFWEACEARANGEVEHFGEFAPSRTQNIAPCCQPEPAE